MLSVTEEFSIVEHCVFRQSIQWQEGPQRRLDFLHLHLAVVQPLVHLQPLVRYCTHF